MPHVQRQQTSIYVNKSPTVSHVSYSVRAGVPLRNLDRRWNVAFCFHAQELTYKTDDLIVHNDCTNSCIQYSMATDKSIPYGQPIEVHYPLLSGTLQYYVHNSPPMPSAQAHLPSPSSSSRDFHPTPLPFLRCTVPSLLSPIPSQHCANPPSCLRPRVKRDGHSCFPIPLDSVTMTTLHLPSRTSTARRSNRAARVFQR